LAENFGQLENMVETPVPKPLISVILRNVVSANQLICGILNVCHLASNYRSLIVAVIYGIGTTTLDKGDSFLCTRKPNCWPRGHKPEARNSSTASRPPIREVTSMKAIMLASIRSQQEGTSVR
jgi:hypothetical protein